MDTQRIEQSLQKVLDWIEQSIDPLAGEQIPALAHDIVTQGIVESSIKLLVYLMSVFISTCVLNTALKHFKLKNNGSNAVSCCLFMGTTIFFSCFAVHHVLVIVNAIFTPRLYVIEQLGDMIG